MSQGQRNQHRQRDAASLLVMGGFFMLLAILVLQGGFWARGLTFPSIVNLAAGAVLFLVGLGMYEIGRRWRRGSRQAGSGRSNDRGS